jgi:hypothetical protein
MRIERKIDPYNYPLIIIAAFVLGMTLAIALGFRPQHGGSEKENHGADRPAVIWMMPVENLAGL